MVVQFVLIYYFFFTENDKSRLEVSKGPISFSIKAKDAKKPKIEYRTSVIYKQSYEQGQSDEDADEADSEADSKETPQASGGKENINKQESSSSSQDTSEQSAEDLNQQMDSIKAAERIGMCLAICFIVNGVTLGHQYVL